MTKTVIGKSAPANEEASSSSSTSSSTANSIVKKLVRPRSRRAHTYQIYKLKMRAYLKSKKGLKKMLAVMSEECSSGGGGSGGSGGEQCRDVTQDFLTTGRVGRRNALPDILGEHARLSTAELPDKMGCLSVSDESSKNQSPSQTSHSAASGSSTQQPRS